jgi:hypothetical protein
MRHWIDHRRPRNHEPQGDRSVGPAFKLEERAATHLAISALVRVLRTRVPAPRRSEGLSAPARTILMFAAVSGPCLSSGGKVQRVISRRRDVTYAAFFTCPIS